jgi:crotonobetainyl-CoA:carnitine CoA-transferase CaiB-like acyl-CoA transferase
MLHGVKVLDLTRVLAGPLAAMTLGDLGASVIKVERPGMGDESRGWGPPFDRRGESAYYLCCNRNKLGVAADLDTAEGQALVRQLALEADVVIDNFRVGTLERRELAPLGLLERNPNLVWCTLTGFGPDSVRPGYDFVVQAESGWMAITGEPDGEPMKAGIALVDVLAGKDAAIAVLAALAARGTSPSPPAAERKRWISLAHSATSALINVAQNALVSGAEARRWGNAHANLVPYQLFRAADRHIVVAVGNDTQWLSCCRALELTDLAQDLSLRTNAGRLAHRDRVVARLGERLASGPAATWIERLSAAGVPSGVIRTPLEVLDTVQASPLTGIAPTAPATVRYPPPRLDEHGAQVRAMGWRAFDIVPTLRNTL